jgi:hypothetical protein
MRVWPFLKLTIPLGTLAALALAYGIQRLASEPETPIDIVRPPPTTFTKLAPPVHGHKLAGQVTSPTGENLDRALVWVRSGDEGSFTYTNAQGAFGFEDLGPGPWPAKIVALGHEPLDLTLQESDVLQRIALKTAYGPPPKLAPLEHAPLAGRIVLPEHFDASHFEVLLRPEAPTSIDSAVPRRAECDAQGTFKIDDLIVARYDVRVLPAWARGGSWPDLLDPSEHGFTHQQGASELVLHLAFGTIEGTLVEPITKGPDGQPLPVPHDVPVEGALVELALAGDSGRVWLPESTDAAGRFRLSPLPRGRYLLTVRAGAITLPQEIELGAGEDKQVPLRLVAPAAGH